MESGEEDKRAGRQFIDFRYLISNTDRECSEGGVYGGQRSLGYYRGKR